MRKIGWVHRMEIVKLGYSDGNVESFLNENKHSVLHRFEYKKFIEEAFGCKYELLAVVDNEMIKVVLPIVEVKSKLLGNKIISSAYLEYGGFAGSREYVNCLIDYLNQKYKNNNEFLEIRGGNDEFDKVLSAKLVKKNLYKRFVLDLSGGEEAVWRGIQKSKRKAIKKAEKNVQVRELAVSDIDEYYDLYCENMKCFGSPPYAKKYFLSFFRNIVDKGLGRIYGAFHQDKLVAVLLGLHYGDRVHIVIAVSDPKYQQFRANDAVHWHFIKWAISEGYKYFDFGRVREDSGQFEYKRKWGPGLFELPSYFLLWRSKEIPIVDPAKHELVVKVWRRMPLWFTKLVGHSLRKGLGI